MAGFGELVSTLGDLMGDYNAVKKGKVSQRVGSGEGHRQGHAEAVQVTDQLGHAYLGQLCNFADILPTYVKGRNVTVRGYRHNRNGVQYTKRDAARYKTTAGDIGPHP